MSYFDSSDQYKKSRPVQRLGHLSNDIYKQRTAPLTVAQPRTNASKPSGQFVPGSQRPLPNLSGQKRVAQKTPPRMPKAKALTLIARLKKGVVAASFLCFGTLGIVIMRNSTTTTTVQPKSKVTTTITTPVATSIATPTVTRGSTVTPVATSTPIPTPTATSTSSGYGFGSSSSSQSPVSSSQSS